MKAASTFEGVIDGSQKSVWPLLFEGGTLENYENHSKLLNLKPLYFVSLQSSARDEQRGQDAVNSLSKEGCTAKFHQLDILSQESIQKLKKFLEEQYGGLDILINNAGIAYKVGNESFTSFNFVEGIDIKDPQKKID